MNEWRTDFLAKNVGIKGNFEFNEEGWSKKKKKNLVPLYKNGWE
jgi:hypothetical protein